MPLLRGARRTSLAALLVSTLVVGFAPRAAEAQALPKFPPPVGATNLSRSPVGGPPGTDITVKGNCSSESGRVDIKRRSFPPDGYPVEGSTGFTTVGGAFTAHVTNPYGTENIGVPVDAELIVLCGLFPQRLPFHGSHLGTTNSPTLYTTMGSGNCGALTPAPCPALTKAFNPGGAIASVFQVASWAGGASLAAGDLDGDSKPEIVAGSPRGLLPVFSAQRADGSGEIGSFTFVYGNFTGGVNVAVGDVTGDGQADVVTGAGAGGGPHVKVFTWGRSTRSFTQRSGFYAYDPGFAGGVNVAVGDVNNDGVGEIITGAGPGGGPHVRIFDGNGVARGGFYAYDPNFAGGVNVSASDLRDTAAAEIVTAAGPGGGPHVKVLDANGATLNGFYAFEPSFVGGVSVAVNGSARQIVTGAGPGAGPLVSIFNVSGSLVHAFYPYQMNTGGVTVAAAG